jgi:hypothetical protein
MMGKMYRPLRIAKKNRGYQFSHKYMSNLLGREKGGVRKFEQIIELKSIDNGNEVQESIRIEFSELTIPVLVDKERYEQVSGRQVAEKKSPFVFIVEKKMGSLGRKMERPGISIDLEDKNANPFVELKEPEWVFFDSNDSNDESIGDLTKGKWVLRTDMSSIGEELSFEMPIYPTRNNEGTDLLKIEIKPVVVNGEEYMEIKTDSRTQVIIISNTKITFRP